MGTVLAAHHELLDMPVAVKLLSPDFVRNAPMVERFLREARAAARLKSEHVARVTDVGTLESGQPYIVMELLQGEDLEQRRQRMGVLPIADAVDTVLQALEAMAQAHAVGIVHRDLKPGNLFLALLPDGRQVVKVLDFGIAKLIASDEGGAARSITGEHALGSPSYMAPEQIRNSSQIDQRVDVWAIGVILYDLLTGQLPFPGETVGEIFGNVLVGSLEPVRSLRPEVPEDLGATVARCLEKEPEKRFANVYELAAALAPHGSGAWSSYVDRIAHTLARSGASQRQEDTAVRRSLYRAAGQPSGDAPHVAPTARAKAGPAASQQETVLADAVPSFRPPSTGSKRRAVIAAAGAACIATLAAVAVLRPRDAASPVATTSGSATATSAPSVSASESSRAPAVPSSLGPSAVHPDRSSSAAAAGPAAEGSASEKAHGRAAPPSGTKAAPHKPPKRPVLLDSPD
jgi:serine/threonine-protein kinase